MIDGGRAVRRRVMQGAALALGGWLLVACSSGNSPDLQTLTATFFVGDGNGLELPAYQQFAGHQLITRRRPYSAHRQTPLALISAAEAADRSAAEAQWAQYAEMYAALPHTPEDQWDALLASVAVEPMITNAKNDARTIIGKGRDTYGTVTHRFSWPKPIDGRIQPTLTTATTGASRGAYETATGNKVTVGVPRRNTMGTLVRGEDGTWRVSAAYIVKDDPC